MVFFMVALSSKNSFSPSCRHLKGKERTTEAAVVIKIIIRVITKVLKSVGIAAPSIVFSIHLIKMRKANRGGGGNPLL